MMTSPSRTVSILFKILVLFKTSAAHFSDASLNDASLQFQLFSNDQILDPSASLSNFTKTTPNRSMSNSKANSTSPLDARKLMYRYDQIDVVPLPASEDNPSMDGFVKQKCFDHPSDPTQEAYCIFANPTFSNHRGIVFFIRASFLKTKLAQVPVFKPDGVVVRDEDRSQFPYRLEHMPHKGGLGALATKKLQLGDLVVKDHSLVTVFADCLLWKREEWEAILKDMVDLLPIKGRELFARQHGVGDTELEWIASAFDRNVFRSSTDDEGKTGFSFIPEPAVSQSLILVHSKIM